MNDDELGLRLREELRRRINAPELAPEAVHDHLQRLRSMQAVRQSRLRRPTHLSRDLLGVAAAVAICALVAAGLFVRQSDRPVTSAPAPKNGIEAFARIDSTTAWAESGADLYVTRDGGETWSKATLPGGRSPAQLMGIQSSSVTSADAEPAGSTEQPPEPAACQLERFPGHGYPDFVDADHGWLVSWIPSRVNGSVVYAMTAWRTSDGGQSWASTPLAGTYEGLGVIQFVDASHGWITIMPWFVSISDGVTPARLPAETTTVLATTDGGVTWEKVSTLAVYAHPHFVSPTEAWGFAQLDAREETMAVIHSIDGGRTWSTSVLPLPGDGTAGRWANPPTEVNGSVTAQLGYVGPAGFEILTFVSADHGRTWSMRSEALPSSQTGIIVNQGQADLLDLPAGQPFVFATGADQAAPTGLTATFDGGGTWTDYSTTGLPQSGVMLAEWISPEDAWVMTPPYLGGIFELGGQLYATHDRGKTWTPLLGAPAWPVAPKSSDPDATPQAITAGSAIDPADAVGRSFSRLLPHRV
jgi:photosystem II stability/assembly factor-like uncharacterized protein